MHLEVEAIFRRPSGRRIKSAALFSHEAADAAVDKAKTNTLTGCDPSLPNIEPSKPWPPANFGALNSCSEPLPHDHRVIAGISDIRKLRWHTGVTADVGEHSLENGILILKAGLAHLPLTVILGARSLGETLLEAPCFLSKATMIGGWDWQTEDRRHRLSLFLEIETWLSERRLRSGKLPVMLHAVTTKFGNIGRLDIQSSLHLSCFAKLPQLSQCLRPRAQ